MLEIKKMKKEDAVWAARIEAENFSRPWTRESFEKAAEEERALYLTAWLEGEPVGYIGMWIALDEGEITNVSVKKEFQGRGIGRKLMEVLEIEGRKEGVAAYFLEVRESNQKARGLYRARGFIEAGTRRNFYEEPRENAVVMCKR